MFFLSFKRTHRPEDLSDALRLAVRKGHLNIVKLLINTKLIKDLGPAMVGACRGGNLSVVKYFLSLKAPVGYEAIWGAMIGQHKEIFRLCLKSTNLSLSEKGKLLHECHGKFSVEMTRLMMEDKEILQLEDNTEGHGERRDLTTLITTLLSGFSKSERITQVIPALFKGLPPQIAASIFANIISSYHDCWGEVITDELVEGVYGYLDAEDMFTEILEYSGQPCSVLEQALSLIEYLEIDARNNGTINHVGRYLIKSRKVSKKCLSYFFEKGAMFMDKELLTQFLEDKRLTKDTVNRATRFACEAGDDETHLSLLIRDRRVTNETLKWCRINAEKQDNKRVLHALLKHPYFIEIDVNACLLAAVSTNDVNFLKKLLKDKRITSAAIEKAAMEVAKNHYYNCCKELLYDQRLTDEVKFQVLMILMKNYREPIPIDWTGSNVNLRCLPTTEGGIGENPPWCDPLFIKLKGRVSAEFLNNALVEMAKNGDLYHVKLLVDKTSCTAALMAAAVNNQTPIVHYLLTSFSFELNILLRALQKARESNASACLKLLEKKLNESILPLISAVQKRDSEGVGNFLSKYKPSIGIRCHALKLADKLGIVKLLIVDQPIEKLSKEGLRFFASQIDTIVGLNQKDPAIIDFLRTHLDRINKLLEPKKSVKGKRAPTITDSLPPAKRSKKGK